MKVVIQIVTTPTVKSLKTKFYVTNGRTHLTIVGDIFSYYGYLFYKKIVILFFNSNI